METSREFENIRVISISYCKYSYIAKPSVPWAIPSFAFKDTSYKPLFDFYFNSTTKKSWDQEFKQSFFKYTN